MKLAQNLNRLGTESAFAVLAEAKKLEAQGKSLAMFELPEPASIARRWLVSPCVIVTVAPRAGPPPSVRG